MHTTRQLLNIMANNNMTDTLTLVRYGNDFVDGVWSVHSMSVKNTDWVVALVPIGFSSPRQLFTIPFSDLDHPMWNLA